MFSSIKGKTIGPDPEFAAGALSKGAGTFTPCISGAPPPIPLPFTTASVQTGPPHAGPTGEPHRTIHQRRCQLGAGPALAKMKTIQARELRLGRTPTECLPHPCLPIAYVLRRNAPANRIFSQEPVAGAHLRHLETCLQDCAENQWPSAYYQQYGLLTGPRTIVFRCQILTRWPDWRRKVTRPRWREGPDDHPFCQLPQPDGSVHK